MAKILGLGRAVLKDKTSEGRSIMSYISNINVGINMTV